MRLCPLCNFEIDESDLTRHYLNDPALISFIQKSKTDWTPQKGACSRCLEDLFQQYNSSSLTEEDTEEKTVVTETNELIQGVPDVTACLITIHGGELGKKHNLTLDETLIGRGENAHIRINEENVSRLHATLYKKKGEIILEDQNSTNGTFVNTRKIKATPLKDGDLILIGNTILKFMSTYNVEHQYHEEIYRLATLDGLTQLFNKNFFLEKLEDEFGRSKRYDRDLSLLLFDFDHFKRVNDTHGHLAGDDILRKGAMLIQRNMRKEDVCGRYGGEEFGIILPETPKRNALLLAEKIRKLVEGTPFEFEGKKIPITISVGVATLTKEIKNANQFLDAVDRALYNAKKAGRNCIQSA